MIAIILTLVSLIVRVIYAVMLIISSCCSDTQPNSERSVEEQKPSQPRRAVHEQPTSEPSIQEEQQWTDIEQPNSFEPSRMTFGLATVYSYEELKAATNNFHPSLELGGGGYGKVHLGTLRDGRKVAVKTLYDNNPKLLEQFYNEVNDLSRIRHKNLVTLYGCTNPRNQELLLVYEFVPNNTIAYHLHSRQLALTGTVGNHLYGQQIALTWGLRILLAIETAEALTYLHSVEPLIIHRDVKTSNILLDNDFHVKLADLGMCRLLPWDTTHVSTAPQGTMGYRDPEYDKYLKLTDKSDVYSFGVVLLEFITGQQAVDVHRNMDDIYLTNMALNKISKNEFEQLVDPTLGYHSDSEIRRMINSVADLACMCLQTQGNMRPPMVEVLTALKKIRDGTAQK